jgi:hypothetical protein
MLPAARAFPFPISTGGIQVIGGMALLRGWSFREDNGGAPAAVDIYDGTGDNGTLVATITLTAGQSTRDPVPDSGIACPSGIFLNIIAGHIRGSIWYSPGDLIGDLMFPSGILPIVLNLA